MSMRMSSLSLSVCAVVAAAAGSAMAQSAGGFDKPLRGSVTQMSAGSSQTTLSMRQIDGDDTYEIRIDGDEITAKRNGKPVPADRIVREKGEVRILDENGDVLNRFQVGNGTVTTTPKAARNRKQPAQPPVPAPPAVVQDMQPPKVMLGITMSEPGEDLRKSFDLDDGKAILIDRIVPGLAADKAGIKEGDIIIEIEGKKPATQEQLREVLRAKEPGETIEFTILRKSGDQTLRVKLDEYDGEKLGTAWAPIAEDMGKVWQTQPNSEESQKALNEALRNYNSRFPQLRGLEQGRAFVLGGPDQAQMKERLDSKMAELDKKLAELDKRMAKLDEMCAKLQEKLDKLPQGR